MGWGHTGECDKDCSCDVAKELHIGIYKQKPEKTYSCKCGKYSGTKHGLETHKRMQHKTI